MHTFRSKTGRNNLMFLMQKGFKFLCTQFTGMLKTPLTPGCVTILRHICSLFIGESSALFSEQDNSYCWD